MPSTPLRAVQLRADLEATSKVDTLQSKSEYHCDNCPAKRVSIALNVTRQVLSPSKYIAIMKLDLATFAENAHVHRNTVGRAPAAQSIQKHLRENLRLIDSYEAGHGG